VTEWLDYMLLPNCPILGGFIAFQKLWCVPVLTSTIIPLLSPICLYATPRIIFSLLSHWQMEIMPHLQACDSWITTHSYCIISHTLSVCYVQWNELLL